MRVKKMKVAEFDPVFAREWVRVDMTQSLPVWATDVPVHLCLASGSNVTPVSTSVEGRLFGDVVGGIDVIRYAPDDARYGFAWNKDHYVVVRDPSSDDQLLVHGPFKDHEHWLKAIPERFQQVEILTFDADELEDADTRTQ